MKNRVKILAGKLRLNTVPERLWQHISVESIMKLPVSRDYDSILVVYDRFLKISYFIVMTEIIIVEELARLFKDNIWKLQGLLESVISNREPQFAARLMKELNEMLGIEMKLSIAFYLQTDRENKSRAGTVSKNVY